MKRENIDVIDLSVGEPDFPTPAHIKQAAIHAIQSNLTKYTLNSGLIELRQAIIQKLKDDNQLEYELDEIIVSSGAKQCIFNTILSIINRGDEVIISAPYWVSHPEIVHLAEGNAIIVQTEEKNGFKISAKALVKKLSSKTKALILCNPNNPTGAVYSKEELEALAAVIESRDIYIIADEIYEKLIYEDFKFTSCAAISPAMKRKTIVVNGVSKSYAMTGWRIGYAAGDRDIISAAAKIQSHSTTNASSISQYASLEALTGPQDEIERMREEFEKRRDFVHKQLNALEGITCRKPSGAFYAFPNISHYIGKKYHKTLIRNSSDLAEYLLKEFRIALIPGAAFGADNHLRLSYATSMDTLERGMEKLEEALARLQPADR
jgi:aspartate/methionine/tyrosine aminotransferase